MSNDDPWVGDHRGLADEWIIVTGAAGLIGRAVVSRILDAGGRVLAVDRSRDRLTELERAHDETVFLSAAVDIRSASSVRELLSSFSDLKSRMIVHAAGWQVADGDKKMASTEEWAAVFEIHVTAPALFTSTLLETVHQREETASAVFLSSIHESVVFGDPSYGAAKGALANTVRDLAAKAADHGSRVNAVAPGHVAHGDVASPPTRLGSKPVSPQAVATSVLFLLCDHCSPHTTGASLMVDGGLGLQDPWARLPGRPRRRWWL